MSIAACGPSQEEKEKIAAVTCAVMAESKTGLDAAFRVEKINQAREEIGGEPFLSGDDAIKEAFKYMLCEELVLNEDKYYIKLREAKDAAAELARIARETRLEKERIAKEKREKEERIAREERKKAAAKRAEQERIAAANPSVKEEFYASGNLKTRTNYQSKNDGGRRHGLYQVWHENGNLYIERSYEIGKEDGLARSWDSDGKLLSKTCYSSGRSVSLKLCEE